MTTYDRRLPLNVPTDGRFAGGPGGPIEKVGPPDCCIEWAEFRARLIKQKQMCVCGGMAQLHYAL